MKRAICGLCGDAWDIWIMDDATLIICFTCANAAFVDLPNVTVREGFENRTGRATPEDANDQTG